uniref:Uncharacterized protein n=1 Tax=Meloidogyne incognita TaxID=6306 RepID=A0A914MZU6_MELIC
MSLHLKLPKNPLVIEQIEGSDLEVPQQEISRNYTDIKETENGTFVNILLTELKQIETSKIRKTESIDKDPSEENKKNIKFELAETEKEIEQVIKRRVLILRNLDECYFQRIYLEARDINLEKKELEKNKGKLPEKEYNEKKDLLEQSILELKIKICDMIFKDDRTKKIALAEEYEMKKAANRKPGEGPGKKTKGVKIEKKPKTKITKKQPPKKRGRKPAKKEESEEEEFEDEEDEEEDEEEEEEFEGEEEEEEEEEPPQPVKRSTRTRKQPQRYTYDEDEEDNEDGNDEEEEENANKRKEKGKKIDELYSDGTDKSFEEASALERRLMKIATANSLRQTHGAEGTSNPIDVPFASENEDNLFDLNEEAAETPPSPRPPSPGPPSPGLPSPGLSSPTPENEQENQPLSPQSPGPRRTLDHHSSFAFRTTPETSNKETDTSGLSQLEEEPTPPEPFTFQAPGQPQTTSSS